MFEIVMKEVCFRYRLRACKGKNEPLVTYFHGGGAVGSDNIKQFAEFRMIGGGLSKHRATILLPQTPFGKNSWNPGCTEKYLSAVKKLIEAVAENTEADKNRIAILGTSFGGECTWRMIWDYPEYFSCAAPIMGTLPEIWRHSRGEGLDMSRLKNVPIWVAHSANDKVVPIESDDICVKKLNEIGADVKYTRWEKYGHKMSSKFYRREKWVDWLLSQSLDNRRH